MAEAQKKTASANPKEKSSLLDDGIGEDFFNWKSMSTAGDDAMDFNFDDIPKAKGKKEAFSFGKLDMDFNLDGDLDKFSSFKIDMPDLDFSSPSGNSPKRKEKSKEEKSTGKHQGKKQQFEFSFDFNELDDFNFGSSLTGGGKSSKKSLDGNKVTSDTNSSSGSKMDQKPEDDSRTAKQPALEDAASSKFKMSEGSKVPMELEDAIDRVTTELTEPEDVTDMKVKMPDTGPGAQNSIDEACPAKTAPPPQSVESHESVISPDELVSTKVKHTDQPSTLPDRIVSSEPFDQGSLQSSPVSSLPENDSIRVTVLDKPEDDCSFQNSPASSVPDNDSIRAAMFENQEVVLSPGMTSNAISAKEQSVYDGMAPSAGLNLENLQLKSSSEFLDSKQCEEGTDNILPTELTDTNRSGKGVCQKNISAGSVSNAISTKEQSVYDGMTPSAGLNLAKLQLKSSSQVLDSKQCEKEASDNNLPTEQVDTNRSGTGVYQKSISTGSPSIKMMHDVSTDNVQISTPKHLLDRTKDKETGVVRSRFFIRSETAEPQSHKPLSTGEKTSSVSCQRIGSMQLCPARERREDVDATKAKTEKKLASISLSTSRESTIGGPVLLDPEKVTGTNRKGVPTADPLENAKKVIDSSRLQDKAVMKGEPSLIRSENNSRKGVTTADQLENAKKVFDSSRLQDKAAMRGEPVLIRSELNSRVSWRFQANPSTSGEKTTVSSIQTGLSGKPPLPRVESARSSKIASDGLKTVKRTSDLCSFKNSRIGDENRVPSNSTFPGETKSSMTTEQNKELRGNTASKIANFINVGTSQKKMSQIPSLKRKTYEESNVDLISMKPLKRLSLSPIKARTFRESSERVARREACDFGNRMGALTKNISNDHSTSGSEVPSQEVTMTEIETSSFREDYDNVEKAEAYSRELDNICDMLRKKHDEAKELLVRAVVNNNKLLMLNHPVFEEKIRMVQKFAAMLISKELPTL